MVNQEKLERQSSAAGKSAKGIMGSVRMVTLEMQESAAVDKATVASTELFFDLVFLTAVAKLNESVQEDIGFSQYLAFFLHDLVFLVEQHALLQYFR